MSVLSVGLPAMDLQSHYQTFFTGVVVIGAVLLDLYRSRKAEEVKVITPADEYRAEMREKIQQLKQQLRSYKSEGNAEKARETKREIAKLRKEARETYRRMKGEERAEQERIKAEERAAESTFQEMLKQREEPGEHR
jgi:ribose transport system permease protein